VPRNETPPGLQKILDANREWARTRTSSDPDFFTRMVEGQQPSILYIGCSDSRVTAEEMMGLGPGEVFVLRNMANMVSALDIGAMSVIDYAVGQLGVREIIVCGHYLCGGIASALEPRDLGVLNPWMRTIRDVYRLHANELDAIAGRNERLRRFVELNVREECINVLKSAVVQRAYRAGQVGVHGWVFDVSTGLIKDLGVDTAAEMERLTRIYKLD
jgi:carbonic anhydrase